MGKNIDDEISYEVLKMHHKFNKNGKDDQEIHIADISWFGKSCKGVDIRNYIISTERYGKGITVPYQNIDDLVIGLIPLCKDISAIQYAIDHKNDSFFNEDKFDDMFIRVEKRGKKKK